MFPKGKYCTKSMTGLNLPDYPGGPVLHQTQGSEWPRLVVSQWFAELEEWALEAEALRGAVVVVGGDEFWGDALLWDLTDDMMLPLLYAFAVAVVGVVVGVNAVWRSSDDLFSRLNCFELVPAGGVVVVVVVEAIGDCWAARSACSRTFNWGMTASMETEGWAQSN